MTLPSSQTRPSFAADLTIRPFREADYGVFVALCNAVDPEHPRTVTEARYEDAHRDPKCLYLRFVAEKGGELVGSAAYGQWSDMYHPQKFGVGVQVHPQHRRQGVGSALYAHVMAALEGLNPILLRAGTREDRPDALRFLAARGFTEEDRAWESRLELASFDARPYQGLGARLAALGVVLTPLSALMHGPDWQTKAFALSWEVAQDEPNPEPLTKPDFAPWVEREFGPNFLPEAYLIALAGDAWVGMNALYNSQSGDGLYNGLTGVTRPFRRKGVALALKVANLVWAKEQGHRLVKTWNDTTNRPMLAINERLGFAKQPADIGFKKELT